MNAFDAAETNGRTAELEAELDALFDAQNDDRDAGRHLDPGNVPPRDGCALKRRATP